MEGFVSDDVQVLTISCDHMFSQRAFADREGYFFPLLSDFWPHGDVARRYGIFQGSAGAACRGTFLVDRHGVIRWTLVNEIGEARDFSGYHTALKELLAAGWGSAGGCLHGGQPPGIPQGSDSAGTAARPAP